MRDYKQNGGNMWEGWKISESKKKIFKYNSAAKREEMGRSIFNLISI
jgi:hypothetical protein